MTVPSRFGSTAGLQTGLRELEARLASADEVCDRIARQIRTFWRRASTNGPSTLVLGLSGGVDSAVALHLAVRAVGLDGVHPLTLPAFPDDLARERAALVRDHLGFPRRDLPYEIYLRPALDADLRVLSASSPRLRLDPRHDQNSSSERLRFGNLASRMRVAFLYDLASVTGGRVLGCGNRTEMLLGYSAKYGTPISHDYGVLDDLYKVDVLRLATTLGVPESVRTAIPSTGYFPGQTHEAELGAPLRELDVAVYLLIERKLSTATIAGEYGADPAFLEEVLGRFRASAHKRLLKPPHVRVSASKSR